MGRGVQLLFSSLKFILGHDTSGEEPLRADYKRINADASHTQSHTPATPIDDAAVVDSAPTGETDDWGVTVASPRRRHAASQAAHNERAVRRLESGASD